MAAINIPLTCSICSNNLDDSYRLPRLIPNSGDTICQLCTLQIVDHKLDFKSVPHLANELQDSIKSKEELRVDDFPLNLILVKYLNNSVNCNKNQRKDSMKIDDQSIGKLLLDGDGNDLLGTSLDETNNEIHTSDYKFNKDKSIVRKPEINEDSFSSYNSFSANIQQDLNQCEQHRRQLEIVCLDCKSMICTNCALFGQHRGHTIHSKEDIILIVEKKCEGLYEYTQQIHENQNKLKKGNYDEMIKEQLKEFIKQKSNLIQREFNQLRKQLNEVESQCLKQVNDLMQSKLQKWYSWWDQQLGQHLLEEQVQDWLQQTQIVFNKVTDKNDHKYWDLLHLIDNCQSNGKRIIYKKISIHYFDRQIDQSVDEIKRQQDELIQTNIYINFNQNGIRNQLDNFCQITQKSQLFMETPKIGEQLDPRLTLKQSMQEDSDLLMEMSCSLGENSRVTERSCYEGLQSSPFGKQVSQPQNGFNQFNTLKNKKHVVYQNTNRFQRSITPQEIQIEHSLSPLSINGFNENKQKNYGFNENQTTQRPSHKRNKNLQLLIQKMHNQFEELKRGKQENIVEIMNIEFNSEISNYLGNEMRNWNVRTVKLMKNKIQDEHIQVLFESIGQYNTRIQSINLAQNNLSDRTLDLIMEMKYQNRMSQELRNIILSQNKINARNSRDKVQQLKVRGLTITL